MIEKFKLVCYSEMFITCSRPPLFSPLLVQYFWSFQSFASLYQKMHKSKSLLDYNRKSLSLTKICSKHKMYLWSWRRNCQNVKKIHRPPAEILAIQEKQRISYSFHSNNLRKTTFCKDVLHA